MSQITNFLEEDKAITTGAKTVVDDGILETQNDHKKTLKSREDAKKKAEDDKE